MLASPVFLFGSAVATVYVAVFHFWAGRAWMELLLYWLVGLSAFMIGQAVGAFFGLDWLLLGQLHIVPATVACWAAMLVARRIGL